MMIYKVWPFVEEDIDLVKTSVDRIFLELVCLGLERIMMVMTNQNLFTDDRKPMCLSSFR